MNLVRFLIFPILFFPASILAQWTEPERITFGQGIVSHRVASRGQDLFAVGSRGLYISFLRSSDNGDYWSEPINPAIALYHSMEPDMVISGDFIHLVFIADSVRSQPALQVYHISSSDDGTTWGPPHLITRNQWAYGIYHPRVAASGDTLYMVCGVNTGMMIKRSFNNGVNWRDSVHFDNEFLRSPPDIRYSMGRLHVFYEAENYTVDSIINEICYRYSDDKGITWSDSFFISTPERQPDCEMSRLPSAAAGLNGEVLVIWHDSKYEYEDVLSRVSLDNGDTWLPEGRITYGNSSYANSCQIVGGRLCAAFQYILYNQNERKTAYSESADSGLTWSEPVIISGQLESYELGPEIFHSIYEGDTLLHCIVSADVDRRSDLFYLNDSGGDLSDIAEGSNVPGSFTLRSYPNPFNSRTTISFNCQTSERIAVLAYNSLGQRICNLVAGEMEAGEHEIIWDAIGMPSGVYFVVLKAATRSEEVAVIHLK